jgi:ABC-type oligopeptide transport system substrate-binding subunit
VNKLKSFFVASVVAFFGSSCGSVATAGNSVYCQAVSETAYAIQKARQSGVSMAKLIEIAERSNDGTPSGNVAVGTIRAMVIRAYEIPRFSSEVFKQRAMEDFRDQETLRCLKGMV